jgi:hypothetical protein
MCRLVGPKRLTLVKKLGGCSSTPVGRLKMLMEQMFM